MQAYLIDVVTMLLRWLHVIVAVAWIGASFYFIWLDNSLEPPVDEELRRKGVCGELWAVHGGGFYNPQKYLNAPKTLPPNLHWFKWESYATWLSGFALISTLYYAQASSWMLAPGMPITHAGQAVMVGLTTLAGGWLVYDGLCRLLLARSALLLGALVYIGVVAVAWGLTHLISGRAAFIHVGAMLATIMSANVYFWIIPGQRKTIAQMQAGQTPDPIHGLRAKQRSLHNNYFTLPVLFCMISNHYAVTYSPPQAWLVLALILLAGVLIRHFFNLRHKGILRWRYPIGGCALLLGVVLWLAPPLSPQPQARTAGGREEFALVQAIIQQRCVACHAAHPTLLSAAPAGVMLDTPERILSLRPRIVQQAVQLRIMPLANLTHITEEERAALGRWGQQAP